VTGRLDAPAARSNGPPILDVLARILPAEGMVLEVASGTGQHAGFFAPRLAPRVWQPSDLDGAMFDSIRAWTDAASSNADDSARIRPPIVLDASAETWPIDSADAIVCINMIHIAPIEACSGLLAGAGRVLPPGGPLYLYGPFMRHGAHTAPSNQRFDQHLRSQDARWGVRDLDAIAVEAAGHGLVLDEIVEMPANNLSVIFRKRAL
jgi:SAM-dependent methyltransferase